ncbi:MAG: RcnB family protein [Allorhizobium sp.]
MKKFLAALLCCATLGVPLAYGQQPASKQPHSNKTLILKRGAMLPPESRGTTVRQNEYKKHKLRTPGKGQKWVKIKGSFVLIESANGKITAVGR